MGFFPSNSGGSSSSGGSTSISGLSDVNLTTKIPTNNDVLTYDSVSSKWVSKVNNSAYTLELVRWGVSNNNTNAVNTSNGINNALTWASAQGYEETILPFGTYLISETIPVSIPSYMTLNLNGSTLQINTNKEVKYSVIAFQNNQVFSRVTNGILRGDRDTHDYYYWSLDLNTGRVWELWHPNKAYAIGDKVVPTNTVADSYTYYFQCTTAGTSGATEPNWYPSGTTSDNSSIVWTPMNRHTHEGGNGVIVGSFTPPNGTGCNTQFITVDNLEMYNFTGDGLSHQLLFNQIYFSDATLFPNFEAGGIYLGETSTMPATWVFGTHYAQNTIIVSGLNTYLCTLSLVSTTLSTIAPTGTGTTALGDGYTWQYKGTLGATTTEATRIRSINTILMSNTSVAKWGYFQITGDSYGGLGSAITATLFDAVFYNADNSFNSCIKNLTYYDDIIVPSGASYAKIVLHQGVAPTGSTNNTLHAHVFEFPRNTYTEKCKIHNNRRLGISVTGAKNVYIRDNTIHDIGGTGPAGSIDIEDGYRINQHIFIERNSMYNTSSGLSVVAGRYVTISNNHISDRLTVWNNADEVAANGNTFTVGSGVNLWGDITFSNNRLYGNKSDFGNNNSTDKRLKVNDCEFYNCSFTMTRSVAYLLELSNCRLVFDTEYHDNPLFNGYGGISFPVTPQIVSNCIFSGSGTKGNATISAFNSAVDPWIMNNNTFLNTKHVDGIVTNLPPAIYTACKFINAGTLEFINGASALAKYEFNNCFFQWDGFSQFGGVGGNSNIALAKFNGCYFAGGSSTAFYLHTFGGKLMLINNVIDFPASSTSTISIINALTTFNPTSVQVIGNRFSSNMAMTLIDLTGSTLAGLNVLFKDNVVDTVQVKLLNAHKRKNNYIDGVFDPYFNVAALPTSDYYTVGQVLLNSSPAAGGSSFIGWVCTTSGRMETAAWTASTFYSLASRILSGGHVYETQNSGTSSKVSPTFPTGSGSTVNDTAGMTLWAASTTYTVGNQILPNASNGSFYECTITGTSGTSEPAWTTTINATFTDGGVTWKCIRPFIVWKEISVAAVFKTYGAISS